MLKKITAPAAGADDAELHRVVGASCLQHAGRALYRWDGGRHRGHRSCGLHEIAAGDILILRHDEHLILLFSPHFSMHVLVTELLVARIVQWMLRPAAVALWLGTLIVPLHTQPAPPPPSPVQIKDLQIPKLTTPPRIEQFLGGASRPDLRRIDDFRQRQPGDGVPVSRKTSAWIGYDDRN